MTASPPRFVTLVTGASSGIGAALARELAADSTDLVLTARREERLTALADELKTLHPTLRVHVLPTDLAEPKQVQRLIETVQNQFGGVDRLINNAGIGQFGLFEEANPDAIDQMLQVNIIALTGLTRALLPEMVARGRGQVLMVSSGFGLTWLPMFSAYVGTKHYVTGFSESLRAELAGTGVSITQLCPGPVKTEFDAVAGMVVSAPDWFAVSAKTCARVGARGLRAGRALVIPGILASIAIRAGIWSPRWVLRLLYGIIARVGRGRLDSSRT